MASSRAPHPSCLACGQQQHQIFSCTFVKKEGEEQVFGTMVAYYNQTFLPAMGTMVMNMASKRLSGEKMDAPLPPTRTPPTQEQ